MHISRISVKTIWREGTKKSFGGRYLESSFSYRKRRIKQKKNQNYQNEEDNNQKQQAFKKKNRENTIKHIHERAIYNSKQLRRNFRKCRGALPPPQYS